MTFYVTCDMTKAQVIRWGTRFNLLVTKNTNTTHRQTTVPATLMSNVNAFSWSMYSEGVVLVSMIIFADTNISGAEIKVHATIALAIYKIYHVTV